MSELTFCVTRSFNNDPVFGHRSAKKADQIPKLMYNYAFHMTSHLLLVAFLPVGDVIDDIWSAVSLLECGASKHRICNDDFYRVLGGDERHVGWTDDGWGRERREERDSVRREITRLKQHGGETEIKRLDKRCYIPLTPDFFSELKPVKHRRLSGR